MSTHEEIMAVYLDDIESKNKVVIGKSGIIPFLSGCNAIRVEHIFSTPTGDGTVITDKGREDASD